MKDMWEKYFIDDTDVLENKLNIKDKKLLQEEEKRITLNKLTQLQLEPIPGIFDMKHLKNIHKFIFEDIYPFAGEFRTCTMAKTTRNFYDPDMIKDELMKELNELNQSFKVLSNNYKNINNVDDSFLYSYATILSNAYYQIMTIHPFREGNGRSTREFLREFVAYNNMNLPFDLELDFSKMNKENALKGVEYKFIFPSMLMLEFKNALVTLKKEKALQ